MRAVLKIEAHEDVKVVFVLADGTEVTVHFRDGELRACAPDAITAVPHLHGFDANGLPVHTGVLAIRRAGV